MMRIKQGVCLLAALLLAMVLLAGCGKDKDESAASDSSGSDVSASDSASTDDSAPAEDASDASGSGAGESGASGSDVSDMSGVSEVSAPPTPALDDGVFLCFNEERYDDDRAPTLTLEDGSFTFVVNTGDARMATLEGSYTLQGSALSLEVKSSDEEDYLGEDLTALDFTVVDENNLRYNSGQLGLTNPGYLFTREGAKPPAAQSAPDSNAASAAASGSDSAASGSTAQDDSAPADSSASAPVSGGDAPDNSEK